MWVCIYSTGPSLTTAPNSLELINLPGQPSELLAALGTALGTSQQDKPQQLGLLQGQGLVPAVLEPWEGADPFQLWDTAGCCPWWSTAAPCASLMGWSCSKAEVVASKAELQHSGCCHANQAGSLGCQTRRAATLPTHARGSQGADSPQSLLQQHHRA